MACASGKYILRDQLRLLWRVLPVFPLAPLVRADLNASLWAPPSLANESPHTEVALPWRLRPYVQLNSMTNPRNWIAFFDIALRALDPAGLEGALGSTADVFTASTGRHPLPNRRYHLCRWLSLQLGCVCACVFFPPPQ